MIEKATRGDYSKDPCLRNRPTEIYSMARRPVNGDTESPVVAGASGVCAALAVAVTHA